MSGLNRGFIVTVALVVGFLIGLASMAFIVVALVPPNIILRDAPPRYLEFSESGQPVGYRDIYVARVANRFAVSDQSPEALSFAQNMLGVTSGDATPMQAFQMAVSAEQAARLENASETPDPNVGYFTLADQNNLRLLADRLDQVKDQPAVVAQSVIDARRTATLLGLALLLLFIALLGSLLWLIWKWLTPSAPKATVTAAPAAKVPAGAPLVDAEEPLVAPAVAAAAAVAVAQPTEPGGSAAVYYAPPSPIEGEIQLRSANAFYSHPDANYDFGFDVNAEGGEMIGECGASVAERIGVDESAPVAALAVWVFDKKDFDSRTKTKVLVTPYVQREDVLRDKAAARGELITARPDLIFEVLTPQLRVEVSVRDVHFRPYDGEPDACFERVNLEYRVFKRPPAA